MMSFQQREGPHAEELRTLLFTAERGGTATAAGIRGVVVDVAVEAGGTTVARFADGSARYLNHAMRSSCGRPRTSRCRRA